MSLHREATPSPTARREPGLTTLVVWLALVGAAVYVLAGLPGMPASLPSPPSDVEVQLQLLVRSPTATQLDAAVGLLRWAFWLGWVFVVGTTLLRVGVILAERAAEGSMWVRSLRWLSDVLTVPFVRRAVDASLAGTLLLRATLATPTAALASDLPIVIQAQRGQTNTADGSGPQAATGTLPPPEALGDLRPGEVVHIVRPGESLASIAERYFGDPERWNQIYADNRDRPQPEYGSLHDAGKIFPGWLLVIRDPSRGREPTPAVEFDADGQAWHTVRKGESLWTIADAVYGDGRRWPELFAANEGAQLDAGRVLRNPNLIWPSLRLRVPGVVARGSDAGLDTPADGASMQRTVAEASSDRSVVTGVAADRLDRGARQELAPASAGPSPITSDYALTTASTPEHALPVAAADPSATPSAPPTATAPVESGRFLSPAQAALAAGGAAAAAVIAGRLVVRRRKPAPMPSEAENDVEVVDGFAEADPVHDLARRLARTADPAAVIAGLLGRAYVAVFDEQLSGQQREEASQGVSVAATRHGRTSTTLVLAAPVAARPHLVRGMRAAAARAFGEHVDVDGLVDQNGDVLVRVTWDPKRPIGGDLLERAYDGDPRDGSGLASVWAAPCLLPILALRDRQYLSVNWHSVRNVLVAAPAGQGADVPVTALLAALASVRAPEDLGLLVVAQPHALPAEIGAFPHGLGDVVDASDAQAVRRALEGVVAEVDRRRQSGATSEADLAVVVRELCELEPDAQQLLGAIAAAGPDYGVRLIVASERPASELLSRCPFVDQLGTRLVLQATTEEDSVALLGTPGAERLGAGGYALLRLEGRLPVPGWTRRVSADRLAGLVHMMGSRAPAAAPHADQGETAAADLSAEVEAAPDAEPAERVGDQLLEAQEQPDDAAPARAQVAGGQPGSTATDTSLLARLRAAPLRVRCFGAGEVWYGDRLLELRKPELLLLFGVHPIKGIKNEALADMLWDKVPADVAAALRGERFDLRKELRRLVPELPGDPLPGNEYQGEKVIALDTTIASSDVHEFTELLRDVDKLKPAAAIEAYEAAVSLYRGDLLDSPAVLNYRWMYDADPQVALSVRSDYRARYNEARLRLARLLAEGPEDGLARAEELYLALCAEDPEDDHLWTALFRIHERTGSTLGLESAVRRLRASLVELGTADESADLDRVPLPPNLNRLVEQIRQRIGRVAEPAAGGD